MNEISEVLKSTREMSGVSIEEVSKDLEIPVLILNQIEEGNIGAFKDIFVLKQYLSDYAKYLGLNPSEVMDEFNEFMFEVTSKIPMAEIEKAARENMQKEASENRIASPYTRAVPKTDNKKFILTIILIIVLVIMAIVWSIKQITIGNVTTNVMDYLNN